MKIPVALYCQCGERAEHDFVTQGGYDAFCELWKREHKGAGHNALTKSEWTAMRKRGDFNKAMAAKPSPIDDGGAHF